MFSTAYLVEVDDVDVLAVDLGEDEEAGGEVHGHLEDGLPPLERRLETDRLEARPRLARPQLQLRVEVRTLRC